MLKILRLTKQSFYREIRAGEWRIIFFALLIAVTTVTSLHFYTDRIERALAAQSARFLGGDLVIESPYPINKTLLKKAIELNIRTATVLSYPSVVSANKNMQLVTIQAVSDDYPVLANASPLPKLGKVWAEPRTLSALKISVHDSLMVGRASLQVENRLTADMNTLNTGLMIAPRLLMRLQDVPATETVLPGSRVQYRLLLAGEPDALKLFKHFADTKLKPNERILTVESQQAFLSDALGRVLSYLNLVLIIAILMAGVAIMISGSEYLRQHYTQAALWRCLGATSKQIICVLFLHLLIVGLIASMLGTLFGFFLQIGLTKLFADALPLVLPAAGFQPIITGFVVCMLLLLVCAYPVIDELPKISPLRLWHDQGLVYTQRKKLYFFILIFSLIFLVYFFIGYSLLTLYFIAIVLLSIACLYAMSIIILRLIHQMLTFTSGSLRRGLSQLVQYADSFSLQYVGLTLILMSLIILYNMRNQLIDHWQNNLPANTPNYFAINIAPTDLPTFKIFAQKNNIAIENFYPLVRGRLTAVNDQPIMQAIPPQAMNNNALYRELNLSYMIHFPRDNKITAGNAWSTNDFAKSYVSVENKLAQELGFKIGDQLSFQIGDQLMKARIVNLRSVDWTSFHPNFYMIFPPGLLEKYPTTFITSFYLSANQTDFLNQLITSYPNITIIDVAALLAQIKTIVNNMILAVQFLFLFCLCLGALIFLASIQASKDERQLTTAMLNLLGASRKYILGSQCIEFGTLFLLIVCSAIVLGNTGSYLLLKNIFNL